VKSDDEVASNRIDTALCDISATTHDGSEAAIGSAKQ